VSIIALVPVQIGRHGRCKSGAGHNSNRWLKCPHDKAPVARALQDAKYLDRETYPRSRLYDLFFIRASSSSRLMFHE